MFCRASGLAVATTFTYSSVYDQLASVTDALNRTTRFDYDAKGNLVTATDPLNHTTTVTYNGAGQPATVTDALNNASQLTYDLGDLVSTTDPLGRTSKRASSTRPGAC